MKTPKREMNVVFACDSGYVIPLAVCLTSLFENNKEKVDVYILYNKLSIEEIKTLSDLTSKYKQKINFIKVAEAYFSNVPILRWTKETYYRLLVCDLLPATIERLLYLDCDIIISKNIDILYEMDLEGKCLAMLEEKNQLPRVRLGLSPDRGYFQGGVILFDLKKSREILSYEKANKIINELGERVMAADQDIINVMFDGKIKNLDKKFNNYLITNFNGSNLNRLFNQTGKKEIAETYIFHYVTSKPWNNFYSGSCEKIWYKYLSLSPFGDVYVKKYDKLAYKILRTGIMKIIFYKYIALTPYIDNLTKRILSENSYENLRKFYRKNVK
jgi:lipopolysaccharide biosynthesis glycosyltransferase